MSKPYVYITRKLPNHLMKEYESKWEINQWKEEEIPVPADVLRMEAEKADAVLSMLTDQIDEQVLKSMTKGKVVANLAVGYDNIDVRSADEHGITVTNTPDVLTETTADLAFGLLMATARRLVEADNYLREGKWTNWSPFLLAGSDIFQKRIGIVGMGRIGEAVARRAKGFGMEIMYHNRSRKPEAEEETGAKYYEFGQLLEEADFVVCLAPATEETKNMFNREAFGKMKNTAIFVNASRGANVDEHALYQALKEKEIAGAGLDVYAKEPVGPDHPLLTLDRVVCLPHIGSSSVETRERMIELCLENIDRVLQGKEALTSVNS